MSNNDLMKSLSETEKTLPTQRVSNKYAGLNVIGLVADNGACGHYRVINPLHMLWMHGANAKYSSSNTISDFLNADIIIAPRQHSQETYELIRLLQWEKKFVIFEIDDDLHTVLPTSPAYQAYSPGCENLKWLERFMSNCQGMTVTTDELKRTYNRFNKNIESVGNFIDFSFRDWKVDVSWQNGLPIFEAREITKPEHWKDKVVIMWQGGSSHLTDLEQMMRPVAQILEKYPNTLFAYYGAPDLFEFLNQNKIIPEGRYELIKPRHFLDHPAGLAGVDIGLAPIHSCAFNLSKSPLKILEGMAVGQAMIASNVAPYSRFARKHPDLVTIVGEGEGNARTWFEAMEKLVVDSDLRESRRIEGRKLAITEYSLEANFHQWPAAWEKMVIRAGKGDVGPDTKSLGKVWKTLDRNDPCICGSGKKYKRCCVNSHG